MTTILLSIILLIDTIALAILIHRVKTLQRRLVDFQIAQVGLNDVIIRAITTRPTPPKVLN